MYHRITTEDNGRDITVSVFRQQLSIMRRYYTVIPLSEIVERLSNGDQCKGCVAITFDDAYGDFYSIAHPVLKEFEFPSTVFVPTSFVDGNSWLWPDLIRFVLSESSVEAINISQVCEQPIFLSSLEGAWQKIATKCMHLDKYEREAVLTDLITQTGVKVGSKPDKSYSAVTWDELKELKNEGVTVGSHTVSHSPLLTLDKNDLGSELSISKNIIDKKLDQDTKLFCYPFGQRCDFDDSIKSAVEKAGYSSAFVAYPKISKHPNLLSIGRYPATRSLDQFKKNLFGYRYIKIAVLG